MAGFQDDLKQGKEFEEFVREKVSEKFGIVLEPGPFRWVDWVSPLLNVEVKFDRKWRESGNLFFEISYKGNPSGIRKGNFNAFVYGDYDGFFVFQLQNLLQIEESGVEYRKTRGGDGWLVEGLLIKFEEAKKVGEYISLS